MGKSLHGIHHITAISSDPQANIDFYSKLLGLRLVKQTVNYDDPGVYHLYFGDAVGSPGSILTFFPFPHAQAGKVGNGQVGAIGYSISTDSIDYWVDRFSRHGVDFTGPFGRFGEEVITFNDSDGLPLELVADSNRAGASWSDSPVPSVHAIKRFSASTLLVSNGSPTAALLTNTLGFERIAEEGNRLRFATGIGDDRQVVDIVVDPQGRRGVLGPGTVHHIAWRCFDIEQEDWRKVVAKQGFNVTSIIDRNYFHSIYFRENGGILFEIATDEPGFTVDQSETELGSRLSLPPWLEARREDIERKLPPLSIGKKPVSQIE